MNLLVNFRLLMRALHSFNKHFPGAYSRCSMYSQPNLKSGKVNSAMSQK